MRSEVVRLYKTVHTWTGISTGLALFIAFYAGAITMFEAPLARWIAPPQQIQRLPPVSAEALIAQTLLARPEAGKAFTLHLGERGLPNRLSWQKGRHDPAPWSAQLSADGSVQIEQLQPSALPQFIDSLHRTAGIPGDPEIGEHVMAIVSIIYALALISGVIVLLPSLVKDFFALRLGRNLKRMWLDAHNVVGIVSLPFHLVMALSAVVFGLHDQFYDIQDRIIYAGQLRPIMKASNPIGFGSRAPASMLAPDVLLTHLRQIAPGFEPVAMQYRDANTAGASVRVSGNDARYLVRGAGFALLSAVSGELLSGEYLPGRQGVWSATVSSFFALHFGSFGGASVRWSYFFLGLAGAFLFYSGNLLWIETRRRNERKSAGPVRQSRATRLLAAATVGVGLGCIAGVSLSIAAGKWLHGHVADLDAWHQGIYYTVFLASVAWAVVRGAACAAVDLLWLATACTLAIPFASLVAWLAPSLGMWADGGAVGVDAVAALAALGLAWMATSTRRRVVFGASDSVWSVATVNTVNSPADGSWSERHAK